VTRDDRLFNGERIEQADHVADQVKLRVSFDFVGSIGLAVASHIRGDRAVSSVREGFQLMAPRIPGFWKAVAKQNHRSRTLFRHAHAYAVGLDETKCRLGHFITRSF